jgi:hypothetical protein
MCKKCALILPITPHIESVVEGRDLEHCLSYISYDNHKVSREPPTAVALLGKISQPSPNKGLEFKVLQEQRTVLEQQGPSQAEMDATSEASLESRHFFGASKSIRLRTLAATMNKALGPTLGALAGTNYRLLDDLDKLGDLGLCAHVWLPLFPVASIVWLVSGLACSLHRQGRLALSHLALQACIRRCTCFLYFSLSS